MLNQLNQKLPRKELTKSQLNRGLLTIIVILLILLLFCGTRSCNSDHSSDPIVVVDTTVTEVIDTVYKSFEVIDTTYKTIVNVISVDEIKPPDTINTGSLDGPEFTLIYVDTVTLDSIEVQYTIGIKDCELDTVSFIVKTPCPIITKTIRDTVTITKFKEVKVNTEITHPPKEVKTKVRALFGGGAGYNVEDKLPALSINLGFKDRKDRVYLIDYEAFTQSVQFKFIIPLW